jgi:hypothetical protein
MVAAVMVLIVSECTPATPPDAESDRSTVDYIVSVRDEPGDVERLVDLVGRLGGRVGHVYGYALHGFSARMTSDDARRIAADAAVTRVEPDSVLRSARPQQGQGAVTAIAMEDLLLDYGRDRIDQRTEVLDGRFRYTATGTGVQVHILSTGINIAHAEFDGRASYGWDFVDNDAVAADDDPQCSGEGTAYASLIAGATNLAIAKAATPVAVRISNCGATAVSTVLAGVDWVAEHASPPAVVFLPWYTEWRPGEYATLENAIYNSVNAGLTYVVPAGSHAPAEDSCRIFPARMPSVISVSATGSGSANMRRAPHASSGGCVTMFAPGHGFLAASSGNPHGATLFLNAATNAAAYVAGVAAMILEIHPNWTAAEVRAALISDATIGAVVDPGLGAPNRFLHSWPGITLTCDSRRGRIHCGAGASGSVLAQIRWRRNGALVTSWADNLTVSSSCQVGIAYTVEVEVTHSVGFVDTTTAAVTCRSGNP